MPRGSGRSMPGARRHRPRRELGCIGVAFVLALAPRLAAADDDRPAGEPDGPFYPLDTKNLFGFLEGADVGEKGDRSLEFETTGSFGKAQGLYRSVEQEFIFEPTLTDSLGIEFGAHVLGQDVQRAPDLPDFAGVNFMGASVELRYVLIHRTPEDPIQVTLTAEPEWNSIGDAGQAISDFSTTFRAIADVTSSDRRVYGAVNFVYAPDSARLPGQPWRD